MHQRMKYFAGVIGACLLMTSGWAFAQGAAAGPATSPYKPTIDDWVGVNAAVGNYTLGLELHDRARLDKAFWPEGVVIIQPEPGKSMRMPYRQEGEPPTPPGGKVHNVIGTDIPPWHLALSHHFEFQSATRATHYGYFLSVYPNLKTKTTTVGLPGHYDDILEKRKGEWRILQRTIAIGAK